MFFACLGFTVYGRVIVLDDHIRYWCALNVRCLKYLLHVEAFCHIMIELTFVYSGKGFYLRWQDFRWVPFPERRRNHIESLRYWTWGALHWIMMITGTQLKGYMVFGSKAFRFLDADPKAISRRRGQTVRVVWSTGALRTSLKLFKERACSAPQPTTETAKEKLFLRITHGHRIHRPAVEHGDYASASVGSIHQTRLRKIYIQRRRYMQSTASNQGRPEGLPRLASYKAANSISWSKWPSLPRDCIWTSIVNEGRGVNSIHVGGFQHCNVVDTRPGKGQWALEGCETNIKVRNMQDLLLGTLSEW